MDGLQPTSYSADSPRINFQFRLFVDGNDVAGYLFSSFQMDQFQPEHTPGELKVLEIAVTRSTVDDIPGHETGATLVVVEELPVTWGLPHYRMRFFLDGFVVFEGVVEVPTGTPPFRLDGFWHQTF